MKKVYISIPMKGRLLENIERTKEKLTAIVTNLVDEEVEVITSKYNNDENAVWNLGYNIMELSKADIYIGFYKCKEFYNCQMEKEIALLYKIKYFLFDMYELCPDLKKVAYDRHRNH